MSTEEKVLEYVDEIAANLGVAAEHVYEALMKQAMVSGSISVVWASVTIAVVATIVYFALKVARSGIEDGDALFGVIFAAFFVITFTTVSLHFVEQAITAFYNPEYWALKEILSSLKAD